MSVINADSLLTL